jgi:ribonucleotide reductase beta subunit family protein with ferritin-like domain
MSEPIAQLARLLADQKRVEERIEQTQAMLATIQKRISESLAQRYVSAGHIRFEEDFMKTGIVEEELIKAEQSYERLLQALVDMKKVFEQQMRALDEQIVQANIQHLKESFEQKKGRMNECLAGIDRKILGCLSEVQEYQRLQADLAGLNERLRELGAESIPVPDWLPCDSFESALQARLQHLRQQGRL